MIIKHVYKTCGNPLQDFLIKTPVRIIVNSRVSYLMNSKKLLNPAGYPVLLPLCDIPCVERAAFIPEYWFTVYYDDN